MTLDTFFEKFDEFADAPNAVQKMRELILELAVRGKLTKQFPDEESASVLYMRIEQHFKLLRSKNKLRLQPMKLQSIDDLPGIPSNWMWLPLGNLIDYGSSEKIESTKIPGDAWLLDLEDIEKDTSRLLRRKIFHNSPSESTKSSFLVGDVLYGKLRPYLNKVIVADANGYCTTEIMPISTFGFIDPNYLCYALKRPSFVAYATAKSYGMKMPRLSTEDARKAPFPLPPLAEQKRIVAKVDELMALCDRLEVQEAEQKEKEWRLARAALARFVEKPTAGNLGLVFNKMYDVEPAEIRKAILELAVRGRLVEQDEKDESGKELLRKIQKDKEKLQENGDIKADKKTWVGSRIHPPCKIPKSWCWVRLQDVFEISRGGSPRPAGDSRFFGGNIPWITVGEITKDTIKYLTSTDGGLTEEGAIRSRYINPDDLLLTNSGATLGVPKISRIRGCINDGVAVLRQFHSFDLNDFAYYYLAAQTSNFRAVNQGMGQPNLNTSILAGWFFPLPPLAEQKRIVAKVDELMALVDALEAELTEARVVAERLLDAAIAEVIDNAQSRESKLVPTRAIADTEELREAFLIARIVSKAAASEHPLGRFRRTKFSYLAHRRAGDDVTKHYIKKAAGPYSPWAKFDGPEDMARARGYVRDTKADPLEGMVAGTRVGEVEEQVTDPLIGEAVDWVMKNFHFETNDSLELLTTVDFAAVGLRKAGKEISREGIKKVITESEEWTAKLKRELFSDENIDKALKRMAGVFPEMYGKA